MDNTQFININNPPPESILHTKFLNADYLFEKEASLFQHVFSIDTLHLLNDIFLLLSLFFITIIFYSSIRMLEIRKKEHHHLQMELEEYAHHQAEKAKKAEAEASVSHNDRWRKVLGYVTSTNAGEWKLAVIEADSMLEVLLDQLGFKGDTMADKLKAASNDTFRSLPLAWEVHAIRNKIAHEGSTFELSLHEAKRVIAQYEQIFRQYGYI